LGAPHQPSDRRSTHVLQNLDLADLFVCSRLLCDEMEDSPSGFPLRHAPAIFQSRFHSCAFVALLTRLFKSGRIALASFLRTFAQTKEDLPDLVYKRLMSALCGITDEGVFVASLGEISPPRLLAFVQRLGDEFSEPPSAICCFAFRAIRSFASSSTRAPSPYLNQPTGASRRPTSGCSTSSAC
jgi:hypothetical protein